MKRKRVEELLQYAYIISMTWFCVLALLGWLLNNELIIYLGLPGLLFFPVYIGIIVYWEIKDQRKKKKRRREKELG